MFNDRYKLNIDKLVYQRKSEKDTAVKSRLSALIGPYFELRGGRDIKQVTMMQLRSVLCSVVSLTPSNRLHYFAGAALTNDPKLGGF